MTNYLLDTNTVSHIVRGRSVAARVRLSGLGPRESASISTITEAEIRYGLAKRPHAHALASAVEGFLAKIAVLPWDRDEALAYGHLRARMEAAGKALGNLDMLIAAQAIARDTTLVTSDKAFSLVKELSVIENWAVDL
ncbi:MAG TPA: type II toxin-antitoxin system VapC family toxin [Acidobacteriaceae bacterium]|nr:type II toxin-antitoxin system VapC family toxin [Acidobacteriaceae bacterium]